MTEVERVVARDQVLAYLYNVAAERTTIHARDLCEAVGLDHRAFHLHVYQDLQEEGLLKTYAFGSDRGVLLGLTVAGFVLAETRDRVVEDQRVLHSRARITALRHLAMIRPEKGRLGRGSVQDITALGFAPLVVQWALEVLEHLYLVDRDQNLCSWIITRLGQDEIDRIDEQEGFRERLATVEAMEPRARGRAFEGLLASVLARQGCICDENTGGVGEQIDLIVQCGSGFFVCECKWEKNHVEGGVIAKMQGRMTRRPPFFVGVIFSINGFTSGAYDVAAAGLSQRVILLVDGEQTRAIICGSLCFQDLVDAQLRAIAAYTRA